MISPCHLPQGLLHWSLIIFWGRSSAIKRDHGKKCRIGKRKCTYCLLLYMQLCQWYMQITYAKLYAKLSVVCIMIVNGCKQILYIQWCINEANCQWSMQWYKGNIVYKMVFKLVIHEGTKVRPFSNEIMNTETYFYWLEVSGKLPHISTFYTCTSSLRLWYNYSKCLKTEKIG